MRVDVLCFGVLKDHLGGDRKAVELAEGASVADLMEQMRELGLSASRVWDSLAVAVNREYASLSTVLKDQDEVALLPPVSGGCADAG